MEGHFILFNPLLRITVDYNRRKWFNLSWKC